MTDNTDAHVSDADIPAGGAPASVDTDAGSEPKIYPRGDAGTREATAELLRDREERAAAKPPPTPDRIDAARKKLTEADIARARASGVGAEADDDPDIDKPRWVGEEPPTERTAARELAARRAQKEAALAAILTEEDTAIADEQASARANEEWQALVAQEEQQRAAQEQYQRQQQASEQTQHLSQHEHELRSRLSQYQQAALREVPEIVQLAQLAQQDPALAQQVAAEFARRDPQAAAKYARFQQLDQAYRADAAQAELASVHHHQQQRHAFQQWAKTQDDAFTKAHPEIFADRRAQFEAQSDVIEYLRDKRGLSEDRLRQLWNTSPEFRSAEAQEMILDAARHYRAEKALREARPVAHPQPMRPGTRNNATGRYEEAMPLARIGAEPTTRRQIAKAAELVAERRRATARGR